jgi:hypothetical protein
MELEKDVSQLKTGLESDITHLKTGLKTNVTQLENEDTELKSDITKLKADKTRLEDDIAGMKKVIDNINDTLHNLLTMEGLYFVSHSFKYSLKLNLDFKLAEVYRGSKHVMGIMKRFDQLISLSQSVYFPQYFIFWMHSCRKEHLTISIRRRRSDYRGI